MEETPFDFRIETKKIGDVTVLLIAGDVDLATTPIVSNRIESLFRAPIESFALDLGAVTFLDSAGIAALLRAQSLAVEHDVPFSFTSMSVEVRRIIKSAGLAGVLGLQA
jgi:anti-sigma B factor antagonist